MITHNKGNCINIYCIASGNFWQRESLVNRLWFKFSLSMVSLRPKLIHLPNYSTNFDSAISQSLTLPDIPAIQYVVTCKLKFFTLNRYYRPLQENSLFPISCSHVNFLPAWSFIIGLNFIILPCDCTEILN